MDTFLGIEVELLQSLALEVNVLKVNSLEIEESYVMVSTQYSWKMK